ncbi:hypothetical protein A2631_00425 [Candidatus Daviesbacteria bacterium RIFCSPHIGHO2_01_FULL_44_29]|uniref:ribose-phosphate diphosphokinase n=1 Tax=Candidatus Daviesbacteria bacterium RIFCSPHIGHO2_02_FULL_43_12 TaxID=1797776 RepID=A0A1F5KJ09_9BACT|nr:MAG: hypothetical protein A2631_00425 [Candidatus Daviesbacteria bacterium RIFCSPHIGHO2_01_FULL_44_29]OGE40450.1 MAG: hypothetical protein A3E86_05635 [Candidatus Daviesbacteria bacterium RIFCSPHIGHO2_12_FULL_47_45]OGE40892.1 MAG: hypothetical protein A3D25_03145 [Candidatus Daviesbacteria bacterium RIFCSPHIGHO2_02_FULL_43_12]OGE70044.1 MAG: hypothetical protein A3B55_02495 [Candidatus Daviesbacteria bacterium RIFCSPLOWO2_01_FULL_43_15]
MPRGKSGYILLTGSAHPTLASAIAKILKTKVYNPVSKFANGETRVRIPINLRKREVFIIQPTSSPSTDEYIIELLLMLDAAHRASASRVTAIIPYFGYSRQDRKEGPRVPISAALVSGLIEYSGADTILSIDLHSEPQQGFIKCPVDNLFASFSFISKIKAMHLKNLVIASPDKGGVPRATAYANFLKAEGLAIVYKERDVKLNDNANNTQALDMIGDVRGKTVLIVDDMIDTGGSLVAAANLIKQRGAKKILACATHGLFSGPALERIQASEIEQVLVTDTIAPTEAVTAHKKIKVVSVAPLLAEAIRRLYLGESLSELFL